MFEFYLPLIDKESCLSWGVDTAPCQAACPLGIDVEGYVTAIGEGDFNNALQIIRERCPLPSVCGRVCHHPCEAECKRGKVDEPLAIRALKRFAADQQRGQKNRPEPVPQTRSEKIAIIGAGPSGLTAAYELVTQGYSVTIFEALPIAGGMLAYGIPEFDLPQEIVQEEIDYLRALGVEIKTHTPIGGQLTLADLSRQGYRAILIATGAQGSGRLPIPGGELEGVIYALPFLQKAKLGEKPSLRGRVLVIGGGNVAIDAARTSLRLGAEKVDLVCIESRDTMPAFEWMIKMAEAEGVNLHPALAPQQLGSHNGKRVSHLDLRKVAQSERDREGRVTWTLEEGPDTTLTMETDWVIVAIGQKVDLFNGGDWGNLKTSAKGTLIVDSEGVATNREGVFAAGDIVAYPSTVVESMAFGRKAARAIHRFLQGQGLKEAPSELLKGNTGKEILPTGIPSQKRQEMRKMPARESVQGFQELELGFTKEQAMQEAKRCLQCRTCNRCLAETYCVAFFATEKHGKRSPMVRGSLCSGCGRCARSCPYANIHLTSILA